MESSALARLSNLNSHFISAKRGGRDDDDYGVAGLLKISREVSEALSSGKAVVALESTIISHGMPYPQNLEVAKEVESIVRDNGAVPATIAILDGTPFIGLSTEQLERLAKLGQKVRKTARRDIAYVVATRGNGATTVSATMIFASMVGIPIFVTGGIGGVHRHGENTMDVSSDLTELGKTSVAVISAGVKSILDIPRTLEYLETHGVCVAAYKSNEFPAFFTARSGCKQMRGLRSLSFLPEKALAFGANKCFHVLGLLGRFPTVFHFFEELTEHIFGFFLIAIFRPLVLTISLVF